MSDKPKNIEEYHKWLKEKHNIILGPKHFSNYDAATNIMKRDLENGEFFKQFNKNLLSYNSEYYLNTGYHLFVNTKPPEILIKDYNSFINKTFRKNILENKKWPDEPRSGWIFPDNWFTQINDIIRTMITVKYLDGVEFLITKLEELFLANGIENDKYYEARDEGYYAVHVYAINEFEIPNKDWDTQKINVKIELQITTQLQEVIKTLTHKHYEKRRDMIKKENVKWQWKYDSEEFTPNYLGHILHYIEGMIMEIRNKQKGN